ncbi:hypothetical protein IIE18_11740 [Pseudomonas sp. V1]|uniref:hypothetical protein n=1 Tax=Pseudomonas arcuscaelestis TaxID=2710591 RepID=UPI00193F2513|nr:hypothetical protein [Pseudomonas arcuscaelestis]MBM3105810.1 hypothetical protein [Pseudomonas arcuscaelestis]
MKDHDPVGAVVQYLQQSESQKPYILDAGKQALARPLGCYSGRDFPLGSSGTEGA